MIHKLWVIICVQSFAVSHIVTMIHGFEINLFENQMSLSSDENNVYVMVEIQPLNRIMDERDEILLLWYNIKYL